MTSEMIMLDVGSVQEISKADIAIAAMAERFMPLVIAGPEDKTGFNAVHDARMVVKQKRIDVEKLRKELKAKSLEFGRLVDGEARRISALIEPIENHLQQQEDAYNAERDRLRRESEEAERAKLQDRIDRLAAVGTSHPLNLLCLLTDDAYAALLAEATANHMKATMEAERLRIEAERIEEEKRRKLAEERAEFERQQAAARAEQQRIEAERSAEQKRQQEEFERQQAILRAERERAAAEQKKIDDQRAAIEREKAEAARAEEIRKAREEAAKQAAEQERLRIARDAEAKRLQEEAEEAARKRAELMRPIRERLSDVPGLIIALEIPAVDHPAVGQIREVLNAAANSVMKIIAEIK